MTGRERTPGDRRPWSRAWIRRGLVAVAALAVIALLLVLRNAFVAAPLERLRTVEPASPSPSPSPSPSGARAPITTFTGSLHMPRGGPYILGFDSPRGRAVLRIDGQEIAAGVGEKSVRRVYESGIAAIEFSAPPGARLLWHPPGRRGPLEYVPSSSLAPEPPDRAEFGSWAGAAPLDGAIAALILAILVGLGIYLAAPAFVGIWSGIGRRTALAAVAVALVAFAVRACDIDAAGQTWDEDVNWSAGKNYVDNWLSLDFQPRSWTWNQEHPPVMKYVAGVGAHFADSYTPARVLSALMMALACALLVPIGRRLASLRVGILAGVLSALSPHLIAHGKVVGHEAPTALFWALAIFLALVAHDPRAGGDDGDGEDPAESATVPWFRDPLLGRMAVIGVVLGLAVFSRFVNVLLAPLIGAILLIQAPRGRRLRTVCMGLAIIAPVAMVVGFAIWPRLWSEPIAHLQEAWAKLRKPHSAEPFLGTITNQPPPYYFAVYLVATAPLGVLLCFGAWLARACAWHREVRTTLVVLAWLLVPMIVMFSPVRQDGVRYIMPCLLALATSAALGLDFALRGAARWWSALAGVRAFTLAGAVLAVYLSVSAIRVHPYYLDYYGEHVGGPAGVAQSKRFEIAWWGEGIAAAMAHVNQHAAPGASVHKSCVEPSHLTWLRADLWAKVARSPHRADWIVVYQPSWKPCPIPKDARLVFEEAVAGAPLVRVYQRP